MRKIAVHLWPRRWEIGSHKDTKNTKKKKLGGSVSWWLCVLVASCLGVSNHSLTQRHKEHKEEKTWWLGGLVAWCLSVSNHRLTQRHKDTKEKYLGVFVSLCE